MLAVLLLLPCVVWSYHSYHHYNRGVFCGDGWTFQHGRCFRYGAFTSSQRKSWFHGEANCQKYGGHLATIRTHEEFQTLKSFPGKGSGNAWIGYRKDPATNDSYVWTEGGSGYVESQSSGNNNLECQYMSSSTNSVYDCTSPNIGGYLCSAPAIKCPESTSDFSDNQCECKKDFIDHLDTFMKGNNIYGTFTKGSKCYKKPPCKKLDSNVVFLVDSSDTTANKKLWMPIKKFVNSAMSLLDHSSTKVGFVTISLTTFNKTKKYRYQKDWGQNYFTRGLPKRPELGPRPIAEAIKKALQIFKRNTDRKNRAVILITTGSVTGEVNGAQKMSQMLQRLNDRSIELLVVGVQDLMDAHAEEALEWVGNDPTKYFKAKKLDVSEIEQVLNRMCIPMMIAETTRS